MAKNHGSQIKDDKQYEALRDEGMSKNKAARIANSNAQGGGGSNPASKRGGKGSAYEDRSKEELQQQAKKVGIEGRSKMNKGELIDALRNH
jgi:Rho termination factor-like protein